ncbi:MAG: hypothetical protein WDL87_05885 [Candidatus Omnitrophota bacterium]|jgi:hypothetical protein
MKKERPSIRGKLDAWLQVHPWLKIVALLLAILVWFYVKGEIETI